MEAMGDLRDPETWERWEKVFAGGAGAFATAVAALHKLKQRISKHRKRRRDLKELGDEIDDVRRDFEQLIDVLAESLPVQRRWFDAQVLFFKTVTNAVVALADNQLGIKTQRALFKSVTENISALTRLTTHYERRLEALEASVGRKHEAGASKRKPNRRTKK
jgi:uncharacterized protein YciW